MILNSLCKQITGSIRSSFQKTIKYTVDIKSIMFLFLPNTIRFFTIRLTVPLLLLLLPACSATRVTPTAVQSEQYQEIAYQGQVPVTVQEGLDQRYPRGFWDQQGNQVAPPDRKRITVKLFSSRPSQPDLAQSISEVFASTLTRSQNFIVVEREQLDQLISEIELNQSGLMNSSDSPKTGSMDSAQIVITGDIIQVGNDNRLEVHAIDMKSGRVLLSEHSNPIAITIQAAETLARRLIRRLEQLVY